MAHLDAWRIDIGALDVRNVSQPKLVAVAATNRHGAQFVNGFELASHPHLQHVEWRLQCACRLHCVLLTQLAQHLIEIQPQLRQPFL